MLPVAVSILLFTCCDLHCCTESSSTQTSDFFSCCCVTSEIVKRDCGGYAIGGLSGGEQKEDFWRMVHVSTEVLPNNKPRYLMGVG